LAVANDALNDVIDLSRDDEFFAVEQSDDGISRVLDRLDEVGIHDKL
jgi:hypothetical protein